MQTRPLGSSGIDASVVAFGAWAIGGWKWGGSDASESVAAIRSSLDAGVTLIDTAAVYGFGLSEELVGQAIADRSRDSVIVATKCGLRWDQTSDTLHAESEGRKIYRDLSPASMRHELEQSLQRLGTDYIDLYQSHWPDPMVDAVEVCHTLNTFRKEGLVRAVGFCNADAVSLSAAMTGDTLDTDQERYSLLDRECEDEQLPVVREHGLAFLAYSPMAQGLLSGRMDPERTFPPTDLRHGNPRFSAEVREMLQVVLAPVKSLARERKLAVEQLVLAWTLRQAGVSHVLVGTRNAEQAVTNAEVGRVQLSDDEASMLDQAAAAWPGFGALAPSS